MALFAMSAGLLVATFVLVSLWPVRLPEGRENALTDAIDTYREDVLDRLLPWSLVALAAALVMSVYLGWVVAGRALRPLQRITDTARQVADESQHERIALDGPKDELRDVADTFDAMLERLDRSIDAR